MHGGALRRRVAAQRRVVIRREGKVDVVRGALRVAMRCEVAMRCSREATRSHPRLSDPPPNMELLLSA